MELLLEVIMYLLVVLGIITVCCTFFGRINMLDVTNTKDNICQNKCYKRSKKDGEKITVIIKYKNISEEEIKKVQNAIKTGTYVEISDVVDKVKYIKVDKK